MASNYNNIVGDSINYDKSRGHASVEETLAIRTTGWIGTTYLTCPEFPMLNSFNLGSSFEVISYNTTKIIEKPLYLNNYLNITSYSISQTYSINNTVVTVINTTYVDYWIAFLDTFNESKTNITYQNLNYEDFEAYDCLTSNYFLESFSFLKVTSILPFIFSADFEYINSVIENYSLFFSGANLETSFQQRNNKTDNVIELTINKYSDKFFDYSNSRNFWNKTSANLHIISKGNFIRDFDYEFYEEINIGNISRTIRITLRFVEESYSDLFGWKSTILTIMIVVGVVRIRKRRLSKI
ncbi:MAG: hypothetical protein HeimC3_38640 [Candidatus Heimdallarchaeota archaeon LC_3]|nr:MAG: hypothetical protein HeimC3_38640 [Candidatus Heimdallarchaeota archaeon LC_3]